MADIKIYTNPVYDASFPDPFVLRHEGEYFAFCTGHANDGRIFGMLRSSDLVSWEEMPGAMEPLAAGVAEGELYWAPEVSFYDGIFYLYYSVGNEKLMHIRVATAAEPQGPYVDAGQKLTTQDFAIDPHIFVDDDGSRHMFYATDFLEYSHIGTGTVVDRLIDPFKLAGDPRPVTRAMFDWQVYDPARKEKGGVRWHTVEGPFVLKRKNIYFEMFSGGNWQNISYGVGYAVSDSLYGDGEWAQQVDGTDTLPLLRTVPEKVIGPGHNSVVVGPNGRDLFCVYHRWQDKKRVMCIDRMDFAGGDRLFVVGPTWEPQPAPSLASAEGFEEAFCDGELVARGWSVTDDAVEYANDLLLVMSGGAPATIARTVKQGDFELSVNLKLDDVADAPSVEFGCGERAMLHQTANGWRFVLGSEEIDLPGFRPDVFHQFRMRSEAEQVTAYIDGDRITSTTAESLGDRVEIVVRHATAVLDMVRYTLI
jgi:GH43 family beta-xylosidase